MTARPMEGPWYTAEEALQKLGILKSELEYAIKKNRITGVVRLTAQPLLLFTQSKKGWTGHATAKYYGHLALNGGLIGALLCGNKFELRDGFGQVMELEELHGWSSANPFGVEGLLEPLTDWQPHDYSQHPISTYCAAFLPSARESLMKGLVGLAEKIDQPNGTGIGSSLRENQEFFNGPDWDQTKLCFDRSTIKPEQLRFAASEITLLRERRPLSNDTDVKGLAMASSSVESSKAENWAASSAWERLCLKLIDDKEAKTSREKWTLLRNDIQSEPRTYDTERIVLTINKDELVYLSDYGVETSFLFSSFGSKLSKLKRKISR